MPWMSYVLLAVVTSVATTWLVEGRRPAFLGPEALSDKDKARIEKEQGAMTGILNLLESTIDRPIRDETEAIALMTARE